jgi:putative two-component system response regulator
MRHATPVPAPLTPAPAPLPAPVAVRGGSHLSFRMLVESVQDIITVLDADGRIEYDSPSVAQVLGYAQGELVGRSAFEFVHGDDLAMALELLLRTVSAPGATASLVLRFRHRDGSWRYLHSTGRQLQEGGSTQLVITSRDVSEREREAEQLRAVRAALSVRLDEHALALERAHQEMLERLARAAEFRDDDTGQHTRRVGELAAALASALGLPAREVRLLRRAAPLHDVGKIGIADRILRKPGALEVEELEVMRTHPILGARLLARGHTDTVRAAEQIALHHHEWWNGSGYPCGLSGHRIPLHARIVALADFFDALTHDRPYRRACPRDEVLELIRAESGTRFDPDMAEVFVGML